MIDLRTAISNVHNDRDWWKKVLLGGTVQLTVFGYPIAEGFIVQSFENISKGFPSPLPIWNDWLTRFIIGLFAVLIDFVFYLLPLMITGVLFMCISVAMLFTEQSTMLLTIITSVLCVYYLAVFLAGVSPIGRAMYAEDGYAEKAISMQPLRESLRRSVRGLYFQARLRTLLFYIPSLILLVAIWFALQSSLVPLAFVLMWLFSCSIFYAHLLVAQVYGSVARETRYM